MEKGECCLEQNELRDQEGVERPYSLDPVYHTTPSFGERRAGWQIRDLLKLKAKFLETGRRCGWVCLALNAFAATGKRSKKRLHGARKVVRKFASGDLCKPAHSVWNCAVQPK